MLDRTLIQSPSSLTTTSLPSAPTSFSSAATGNTKSHNNTKHSLYSTIHQYDSLGLPSTATTTNKQKINSRHHHHRQPNSNSFIMQQLKHLKQHQQPTSTTPSNSGTIKAELIDAKFEQLAKRVLSQLNQRPVEFFHSLDNILAEPLDQREIEIREAKAAKQAGEAAMALAKTRRLARRNKRNVNNDNCYYEKTSGNIVNVTGNTPPSAASRTKAIQHKSDHKSISHNNNNSHYHSIERISSPSHHHQHAVINNNGRSSRQRKGIFEQADSSFEIEQLVYSEEVDDDDDDDDFDDEDDESLDDNGQNYITHGDMQTKVNLENLFVNNNSNRQTPQKGIVKKTINSNNNLAHLNPIMRSNSLGARNDSLVKVKSPTKQNIITSPNRHQQQSPVSLQKSKTSHESLSVKTTIGNINNSNNVVQPAPRRSPSSRNSHHDFLLMSSSQQHQKHHQPTIVSNNNKNNNEASKLHQAEPNSNQLQQHLDQNQALNILYKPHTNYSTSLLANQHRFSDDDEIIIIPTKSPSLISNPSPDPDFASNSGFDNDSDAAAAAAANDRFSISRTKSFWEKLSNNKTVRGVNRTASATKSPSTSLIGNNNNSITGNLNNNDRLNRVYSGISTSENNNNIDYKHRSLTDQNDPNNTANENISTYDRYHFSNNQYSNY